MLKQRVMLCSGENYTKAQDKFTRTKALPCSTLIYLKVAIASIINLIRQLKIHITHKSSPSRCFYSRIPPAKLEALLVSLAKKAVLHMRYYRPYPRLAAKVY